MPGPEDQLAELRRAEQAGAALEFVLFWNEPSGRGCLSQFWPAPFVVDGITSGDEQAVKEILAARTAREAKAAGRRVRGFSDERWEEARYGVVVAGNLAKFSQNDHLRRFLVSTGERLLVEASPFDRVWGVGLAEDDERATSPSGWRGRNLLGFALMGVREAVSRQGHR